MSNSGVARSLQTGTLSVIHNASPKPGTTGIDKLIIQTDLRFGITGWNNSAAEFFGGQLSNGLYFFDLTNSSQYPDILEKIGSGLRKQGFWNGELSFRRQSGNLQQSRISVIRILKESGGPSGILILGKDLTDPAFPSNRPVTDTETAHEFAIAYIRAQEEEKSNISRELHDNVNQILMCAKLYMESARQTPENAGRMLEKAIEYQVMALQEIRKLTRAFSSPVIGKTGLKEGLTDLVLNLEHLQQLKVNFYFDPKLENLLSPEEKKTIYRVIQEQSNNIIRHAAARSVSIEIRRQKKNLRLIIRDDGKGFDMNKIEELKGIGLRNIQYRASAHNGQCHIESSPGKGCCIELKWPIGAGIIPPP